jgi:hypothetical protein
VRPDLKRYDLLPSSESQSEDKIASFLAMT